MAYPTYLHVDPGRITSSRPGSGYRSKEIAHMVHRRETESIQQEWWNNVASYFKRAGTTAEKYQDLSSERKYQQSIQSWEGSVRSVVMEAELTKRREKLKQLLSHEEQELKKELKGQSSLTSSRDLAEMKKKVEFYRQKREEERSLEAERKLHQHWKQNNPQMKELERIRHQKDVAASWNEQLQEKEREKEAARVKEAEEAREREAERRRHEEEEARYEAEKRAKQWELRIELDKQMEELKLKEVEEKRLREEEALLLKEQAAIEKLLGEQKKSEESRKLEQLRVQWSRQYQAKMKLKALEVQASLDEDRRILQHMLDLESRDRSAKEKKREEWRKELEHVKQVLEEQTIREKEREKEQKRMFDEEAAKLLDRREEEWRCEEAARRRLMEEVIAHWKLEMEERQGLRRDERLRVEREKEEMNMLVTLGKDRERREQREKLKKKEELKKMRESEIISGRRRKEEEKRREEEQEMEAHRKRLETDRKLMEKEMNNVSRGELRGIQLGSNSRRPVL